MSTPQDPWASVEVLAEPTRRLVYDAVRAAPTPLTRDAVAEQIGVSRRLAAFHLDRLAEAGLLDVHFRRPPGRSGPGAGRPAKHYSPAAVDLELSMPPRRYNFVARILAAAIAEAPGRADESALVIARREGERIGRGNRPPAGRGRGRKAESLEAARSALSALGYEPASDGDAVRLRNCPFHEVVDVAPALVCGLNQEVVSGLLDGLGVAGRCVARLDGAPPDCCVTVAAAPQARRRAT